MEDQLFRILEQKVLDDHALGQQLARWKELGKRIVFTNGCFDLMHRGHIYLLSRAAELGDALLVGLNSDESVRRLKGPSRPVMPGEDRALLVASLLVVDAVVLFGEDTPARLIERVAPDILVKGGDYDAREVVGASTVLNLGGRVEIIPLLEGYSSTAVFRRLNPVQG